MVCLMVGIRHRLQPRHEFSPDARLDNIWSTTQLGGLAAREIITAMSDRSRTELPSTQTSIQAEVRERLAQTTPNQGFTVVVRMNGWQVKKRWNVWYNAALQPTTEQYAIESLEKVKRWHLEGQWTLSRWRITPNTNAVCISFGDIAHDTDCKRLVKLLVCSFTLKSKRLPTHDWSLVLSLFFDNGAEFQHNQPLFQTCNLDLWPFDSKTTTRTRHTKTYYRPSNRNQCNQPFTVNRTNRQTYIGQRIS